MHVNFLHPFFKPIADCDVVSSDGYTVQNLVSSDFRENSKGFLAAHFIKPPALLLFQLPFPVHVESMIIKPKVGSQISSGIAVLVAGIATKGNPHMKGDITNHKSTVFSKKKRININNGLPLSSEKRNNCQQTTARNFQKLSPEEVFIHNHNYELNITPTSVKGEHSHFFSQVAWLTDREGRTFHLENSLFQERFPVQGIHQVGGSDIQQGEFQRLSYLRKVTHVALKIARLSGSSVPAIGKVEIWGQPSACCQPGVLEYASQVQEKIKGGIHGITFLSEVELGHEEAVTRSLDSAVIQTLSGLHKFTRNRTVNHEKLTVTQSSTEELSKGLRARLKRTAPETSETWKNHIKKKPTVLCVSCDQDLSSQSIFHLPCQHSMCRSCLLKETPKSDNESACKLCKTKFRQTDIVRVHHV
ncbi:uncharacterized protein LOC111320680 isoform X2 [Stylophora pistillata]|uniref:uncharacterized protein LOC111320680 isoform X2 n=1 Tax=Stylophora pistillata TaxID=50429 RepID=UPI000C0404F8|nr:uncharacterized protein LOC111320680 isoform X2 [Stylophora pistillata]